MFSKNISQVSSGASSSFPPDSIPNQRIRYHNIIFHCSPLFLSYPYFSRPFWLHPFSVVNHFVLIFCIRAVFMTKSRGSFCVNTVIVKFNNVMLEFQSLQSVQPVVFKEVKSINSTLRDISISFSLNPFTSNTFFRIQSKLPQYHFKSLFLRLLLLNPLFSYNILQQSVYYYWLESKY